MQHRISDAWSLQLPEDGQGAPTENGDLLIEAEGRTIIVSTWQAEGDDGAAAQLDRLKAADRPYPRAEFDEHGPDGTLRWAFLLDERDDDHEYMGLYGYVLAERAWLQVAVLFDDRRDHDEALMIWRSVRYSADAA